MAKLRILAEPKKAQIWVLTLTLVKATPNKEAFLIPSQMVNFFLLAFYSYKFQM